MGAGAKRKVRFGRLLIVAGLSLGILLATALFIVPRFIPWEKIKGEAEEKLSQMLHHRVSIGALGFNVFTGLEVKELVIANAPGFSREPLLRDEAASVRYRLWPLLFGKLAIKDIELKKPQVCLEKNAAGKFNFSDFAPTQGPEPAAQNSTSGKPALPLELLVSRFAMTNAQLIYRDQAGRQEYRVDACNLMIKNLTLAGLTPVETTLDAQVAAWGRVYPVHAAVVWRIQYANETFKLDRLDFTLPGLQAQADGSIVQLFTAPQLKLKAETQLNLGVLWEQCPENIRAKLPKHWGAKGNLQATLSAAGPAKSPEKMDILFKHQLHGLLEFKDLNMPVDWIGQVQVQAAVCQATETIRLPGSQLDIQGTISDLFQARLCSLAITGKSSLAEVMAKCLPKDQAKTLPPIKLAGTVAFSVQAQGTAADPKNFNFSGEAKLHDVGAAYAGKVLLHGVRAAMQLTPQRLAITQLAGELANEPFTAKFQAENFDLRQPRSLSPESLQAKITWDLNSKMLDVDTLLALLPGGNEKAPAANAQAQATVSDLPEPDARKFVPTGLSMRGHAALGGMKFGKVSLGKIDSSLVLARQQLTTNNRLQGYQGQLENSTQLDFSHPNLGYQTKTKLSQVNVEPLLNDVVDTFVAAKLKQPQLLAEIKDKFTGRLSGTLALSGSGLRTATAKPNLVSTGAFTLAGGRIRKFGFQETLAKWFGTDKFRQDIPCDHTQLEFNLKKQVVMVTKFVAESGQKGEAGDIRLDASGKLTLASRFDHFRLRSRLNPRASGTLSPEFGKYAEVLKDEQGWITMPVVLDGPIKTPQVTPDWEWISGQGKTYVKRKLESAGKAVADKAKEFISRQQGKSGGDVQQDLGAEVEKAKEKLKDLDLKKFFQ